MSNPAVFELSKDEINQQIICIEDNIGEAIHLHIGPFRIDMTVKEFEEITLKFQKVLEYLIPLKNFEILKYDTFFLKKIAKSLPYLNKIEKKIISIKDLKIKYENEQQEVNSYYIYESPLYKFYNNLEENFEKYDEENFIFQSNYERNIYVYNFILENDKNYKENKICVDSEGYILDGYKTVCALAKKNGIEKKIEIEIMYFENGHNPLNIKRRRVQLW